MPLNNQLCPFVPVGWCLASSRGCKDAPSVVVRSATPPYSCFVMFGCDQTTASSISRYEIPIVEVLTRNARVITTTAVTETDPIREWIITEGGARRITRITPVAGRPFTFFTLIHCVLDLGASLCCDLSRPVVLHLCSPRGLHQHNESL